MNYLRKILSTLHTVKGMEKETIRRLYYLSQRSLISLLVFAFVVTYYLYGTLGIPVVLWGGTLITVALLRLGLVFYYKKHDQDYSVNRWYQLFFGTNLFTAFLISLLGSVLIYDVNALDKVFIVAAIVGLSGGAMSSLFPDMRVMISYNTVILLPLAIALLTLHKEVYLLLGIMLLLYYSTQVVIAYNSHKQSLELARHQQEIIETQEQLFKNRETLEYFYTQAPIAIFSYDLNLKITECNDAFLDLFHLKKEDILGMDLSLIPDQSPLKIIKDALTGGVQHYIGPYFSMKGLEYWVEAKSFPIHDHADRVIGGVVLIENKTKEHEAVEKLKYLASHDSLTQLSNRRGFKEFMRTMIEDPRHETHYSLLFYLDLNRFKYINDSLGHSFGDKLLKEIADRLQALLDRESNLTRLGGDEFVIVLPFISDNVDKAQQNAKSFTTKIHQAFDEAFVLDGVRLYMKTSIGIVIIEPNFSNVEEIVRHADISMYQAKKHGQDHISFYNNRLDEERKETFALQQDLIYALENDGFELYLQPIVNINDNAVNAAEALIRWNHPIKGVLQPVDFIPLAIELGVINEIGWWVLTKVCQTISLWKEEGIWNLDYISININAKQLIKEDFIKHFFHELSLYNIDTQDIKVEITETSLIDNFELTQQVIHELQERGIKCVIDDFGTGYSSLSYLKKLSFSVLKIDREFIFDLESNDANETLIRTIVAIAKQFNYKIVVEGIEKEEQRKIIKKIDDHVSYQGFLISEPIPIEDFKEKFIEEGMGSKE
jgi:diguanylate cyclase (GGDEF)-like protein/PAS domain S-box-containing protein